MPTQIELDNFITAYMEAAIWSSTDHLGNNIDGVKYGAYRFTKSAKRRIADDCTKFLTEHYDLVSDRIPQAGHDFWLTRNHHGCGFWEVPDWSEASGKILTNASHAFGEVDIWPSYGWFYLVG